MEKTHNQSGSKYLRPLRGVVDGKIDVYAVLGSFGVVCPARQHAIKKLLCAGIRGSKDEVQDLLEARDAVERALQLCSEVVFGGHGVGWVESNETQRDDVGFPASTKPTVSVVAIRDDDAEVINRFNGIDGSLPEQCLGRLCARQSPHTDR